MMKRFTTLAAFVAAIALITPATTFANTFAGRVTSFSPTSISVFDTEVVTVGITNQTAFTRLITQKPWQQDTALAAQALRVGVYVAVHADNGIASWVQIATDRAVFSERAFTAFEPRAIVTSAFLTEAARHRSEATALRAAPSASESKRPGSPGTAVHCDRIADRLEKAAGVNPGYAAAVANLAFPTGVAQANDTPSSKEVRDLIANAKTPAEHRKLAKHFEAVAARYEADAADHAAEAKVYRTTPNASESKRPGSPDTAAHCDRLADAARNAATAARELARDHEKMAK
jgi:hypothetical protein